MEIYNNKNTQPENTDSNYESNEPVVVALDIGTTKIVTIIGQKNKYGKIEIKGYANVPSKGVLRGAVANIKDATESIGRSIHEAAKKCGAVVSEVVVGVAGQYIKSENHETSLTISNDEVTESDIQKMINDVKLRVQTSGTIIISIIPQDFTIDTVHGITNPIGYCGKHIKGNFHVVSVNESIIKNIKKCVESNVFEGKNLDIQEYFLEPIASAAAVLTDEQRESGVCLIDIGGGTTDMAIYQNNIIRHSAVIPFGGNVITQDIKEVCKITEKQAEHLKIEKGYAFPSEELRAKNIKLNFKTENLIDKLEQSKTINAYTLSEVIYARLEEIIKFVDHQLELSGYKEKLSSGIILTGGGSLLKGIQNVFMANLGIETSVGIPNQHISTSIEELKSPIYSTAIGLLILGFENLEQREIKNKVKNLNETTQQEIQKKQVEEIGKKRKGFLSNISNIVGSLKDIFETPPGNE
jgi:cell division protein FtsA